MVDLQDLDCISDLITQLEKGEGRSFGAALGLKSLLPRLRSGDVVFLPSDRRVVLYRLLGVAEPAVHEPLLAATLNALAEVGSEESLKQILGFVARVPDSPAAWRLNEIAQT